MFYYCFHLGMLTRLRITHTTNSSPYRIWTVSSGILSTCFYSSLIAIFFRLLHRIVFQSSWTSNKCSSKVFFKQNVFIKLVVHRFWCIHCFRHFFSLMSIWKEGKVHLVLLIQYVYIVHQLWLLLLLLLLSLLLLLLLLLLCFGCLLNACNAVKFI